MSGVIKAILVFTLSILVGTILGVYLVNKDIEIKDIEDKVTSIKTSIIKENKGIEKGIEGFNLNEEGIEEEKVYIEIESDLSSVNELLKEGMGRYYVLMKKTKIKYQDNVTDVQLVIVDEDEEIGMDISTDRIESIDLDMSDEFFTKHLETRGWDLLNNADSFWISDATRSEITKDIKEKINWDLNIK